jgi:hypothetical protein
MGHDLFFHTALLLGLLCLGMLLYWAWRWGHPTVNQTTPTSAKPIKTRSKAPTPFQGLTYKPSCEACEHTAEPCHQVPSAPPPLFTCARGRRRRVDTQQHFCPAHMCAYYGRVGLGNLRANGHPGGGPWRQLQCIACKTYFQETHGTPLHGKHVLPEMLVWTTGALAEGLGIRAVARVFEVDPIRSWPG